MLGAWVRSTFTAVGYPPFRLLFLGTIVMQTGFGMMTVVQGIVAFDLTGENSTVGLVALGAGATQVVMGPVGGALTDRLPKRALLIFGQAVVGVLFAVTGALVLTGTATVILLVVLTLVMGSVFSIIGPTRQAWVGDMLQGPERANGIALSQMAQNGSRIVGPFFAGALVALPHVGAGGTYLFMAGLFVLAIALAASMPAGRPLHPARRSVLGEIELGATYIWRTAEVRLLTLTFAAMNVMAMSYQTLMPGFVKHELHHPARDLGFIFGVAALGAIISSIGLAGRPALGGRRAMIAAGVLTGVSVAALALAPHFGFALGALFAVGVFSAAFQLLNNVRIMERCAPEYYGRVIAVLVMSFGLLGVAAYPVGLIADAIGERAALLGCACGALVVIGASALATLRLPGPVAVAAAEG